ncbi:hypothetical protein BD779DRAFT_295060 [Infundibulicybe gibba]|nr:hypothetical protein BD779DRAFT_295060 [Infundibulicybe gibba]
MLPSSFSEAWGGITICILLAGVLNGCIAMQAHTYFSKFKTDPPMMKYTVAAICLASTLHFACETWEMHSIIITGYFQPFFNVTIPIGLSITVVLQVFIRCSVQVPTVITLYVLALTHPYDSGRVYLPHAQIQPPHVDPGAMLCSGGARTRAGVNNCRSPSPPRQRGPDVCVEPPAVLDLDSVLSNQRGLGRGDNLVNLHPAVARPGGWVEEDEISGGYSDPVDGSDSICDERSGGHDDGRVESSTQPALGRALRPRIGLLCMLPPGPTQREDAVASIAVGLCPQFVRKPARNCNGQGGRRRAVCIYGGRHATAWGTGKLLGTHIGSPVGDSAVLLL